MRTPSQTVGPFFAFALCDRPANELVSPDDPGADHLSGQVLDGADEPVDDALVEVWHPDAGFGRCGTDADGRFSFVVPRAVGHLEVMVFARGLLKQVITRVYLAEGPDEVLEAVPPERRETLLARPIDGGLRFDVRLQGERETAFFAL